jgi:hypothetical protein
VGKGRRQAPTYKLSFCCNSRSNRKTQPYYWLSTDHNNNDKTKKQRKTEREKKNSRTKQGKTMNKWAYNKLPTYKTGNKIILKMPKVEIPNRNFSLRSSL